MSLVRSCGASFFQSTLLFPHLLSWVVTSYLVYALLGATNGFVNNTILPVWGRGNRLVFCQNVLASNSDYCLLWKNAGYTAIVYMAGIAGIDKDFEAARIDGASKIKQIISITFADASSDCDYYDSDVYRKNFLFSFGLFYQVPMNSGMLFSVTQTIDTYVYRGLMEQGNIGMSSAAEFISHW